MFWFPARRVPSALLRSGWWATVRGMRRFRFGLPAEMEKCSAGLYQKMKPRYIFRLISLSLDPETGRIRFGFGAPVSIVVAELEKMQRWTWSRMYVITRTWRKMKPCYKIIFEFASDTTRDIPSANHRSKYITQFTCFKETRYVHFYKQ